MNLQATFVEQDDQSILRLLELLAEYGADKERIIQADHYGWGSLFGRLIDIATNKPSADVAETGTSWLGSLVAMNVLRPISRTEVQEMGGRHIFLPSVWEYAVPTGSDKFWCVPFKADVRVIAYWKDMVEQAGLDGKTAFLTPAALEASLEQLTKVVPKPWCLITAPADPNLVHTVASWIWAYGSDFIAPDGKSVIFNQGAALEAVKAYYSLHKYIQKERHPYNQNELMDVFARREVAVVMTGPWVLNQLRLRGLPLDNLMLTSPPGPAFVGGTVLLVWKHSTLVDEDIDLIRYLVTSKPQVEYMWQSGMLPVNRSVWQRPPFSEDVHYQMMYEVITKGRTLPAISLWGMMEERVISALGAVWTGLMAEPHPDVDAVIHKAIDPVADELNRSLNSFVM